LRHQRRQPRHARTHAPLFSPPSPARRLLIRTGGADFHEACGESSPRDFRTGGAEIRKGDNPPVGLLSCSGKDATKIEYATAGMDQQLFVFRYLVALPSAEQLRNFIETDRAALESSGMPAPCAPENDSHE
jgi:hypothetical protein